MDQLRSVRRTRQSLRNRVPPTSLQSLLRPATALLIGSLLSGCGLLIDFDSPLPSVTPTEKAYHCTAEIYRSVGGVSDEFTEQWEAWTFANDENGDGAVDIVDGTALCGSKLDEYVARAQAPGLAWHTRNLDVIEGRSDAMDPYLQRLTASECSDDEPGAPYTTGGPRGAAITLTPPAAGQVDIDATLFFDGDRYDATPLTRRFISRFAERYGLRRLLPPPTGDVYSYYGRHLRFSDVLVDVETPFTLGPVTVNQLVLQSVGTLYAPGEGDTPDPELYAFREDALALDESRQPGKVYFRASGSVEGESETTSFCFAGTAFFRESQGATPQLELSLLQNVNGLSATLSVRVTIDLDAFDDHQPYVALADRETSVLSVDLGSDPGSTVFDNDSDLTQCLWFEDFEQSSERFLGVGTPAISGVRFSPSPVDETGRVTPHELVAACYDSRGAYNVDLQRLFVATPVANDDEYTTPEDTTLVVGPGASVLLNDDGSGVPVTAILQMTTTNGVLDFHDDGTFTYTPIPNFFGIDSFTYAVDHDGLAVTAPATVTITVEEVPPEDEVDDLETDLPGIVGDSLGDGPVNSLTTKLAQAEAELERAGPDATTSACNKLRAFINEVEALVRRGALTPAVGGVLIDRANNIRDELGCR